MKNVDIISTVVQRVQKYKGTPIRNYVFMQGSSVDVDAILREVAKEFLSKNKDADARAVVNFLKGIKVSGVPIKQVLGTESADEATDENVMTSKRILAELENLLRKDKDDETPHSLGVGKNLRVGGTIESGSDARVGGGLSVKGQTIAKRGVQIGESFIPGILTGVGGNIDERGNAELESLVIRRFLEVPELRYNRVEVNLGDKWNAAGAGVLESVAPDYDGNGNRLMTGTGWLKLEDGEIGAIAVGDICMGIFHSMNQADNATEDSDDGMGNFQYSGFYTCYFTITEITGGDNKEFRYQMRPTSDRWKLTIHPSEAMTFVSYGSFTRTDRQTSMYQTRTYTRLLKGQNTWEIGIQNIAMQYGDLSNMNIHGESLDGFRE